MDHHNETDSHTNQIHMKTPSPERPPQLKRSTCSSECGHGYESNEDEGGGGTSDEETLFDPEDEGGGGTSDEETLFDSGDEGSTAGSAQYGASGDFENEVQADSTGGDPSPHAIESEDSLSNSYTPEEMSESLIVEPGASEDQSSMASSVRSIRSRSSEPGLLYWITGITPQLEFGYYFLELPYYFLELPLRLSPQREHCRGDTASQLVT
jgi:hypothetical protein